MNKSKRIALFLVVIAAMAVSAFDIANAAISAGDPAPLSVDPNGKPVQSLPADLGASFSALKSAKGASSLPASAVKQLTKPSAIVNGNIDLAIAVDSPLTPGPVIVIPGDKGVCVAIPDHEGGYGFTCAPTALALTNRVVITDGDVTASLVVDGVKNVTTKTAGGATANAAVSSNVAITKSAPPASLSLDGKSVALTK